MFSRINRHLSIDAGKEREKKQASLQMDNVEREKTYLTLSNSRVAKGETSSSKIASILLVVSIARYKSGYSMVTATAIK